MTMTVNFEIMDVRFALFINNIEGFVAFPS